VTATAAGKTATRPRHGRLRSGAARPPPFSALSVTSELFPLVKTGGLADVAGALPIALSAFGITVHSLLPGYPVVLAGLDSPTVVWRDADFFGGPSRLLSATAGQLALFVLDAPHLYSRPGGPYVDAAGQDWPDNPQRFAALSYAAALLGRGLVPGFAPRVVHAHDWQTGLAPAYLALAGAPRPATVFTIHNLAFHGWAPPALLGQLALPAGALATEGVEFFGGIGLLKAGLYYADRITTVSPTYAAEICTSEGGQALDGLLRARQGRLCGILNGIDTQVWDPARDDLLPAPFSPADMTGRPANKAALQSRLGLDASPSSLLLGVVSRLSDQKGLDILIEVLDDVLAAGAQLAVLGSGDPTLERAFLAAATAHPGRIGVRLGYSEDLAHLIQAGSDAILVPSRFEPCGLTQLCALRYGAIPLVSRVGGLADTIIDANAAARSAGVATGLHFVPVTPAALRGALARLAGLWARPDEWTRMQANAMRQDVGWAEPAGLYAALYREAAAAQA
jgi:starch synthase